MIRYTSVLNFPVTLSSAAPAGGVTITYSTANATATAGSDYVAVVGGSLTIAAGGLTGDLPVTINGDTTVEPDETFSITLNNVTNATPSNTTATGMGGRVGASGDAFASLRQSGAQKRAQDGARYVHSGVA